MMEFKTDIEKIRFAMELRARAFSVDRICQENKEFFDGAEAAMKEFMRKLTNDMKYIHSYLIEKQKYMNDEERKEWLIA